MKVVNVLLSNLLQIGGRAVADKVEDVLGRGLAVGAGVGSVVANVTFVELNPSCSSRNGVCNVQVAFVGDERSSDFPNFGVNFR